MKLRILSACAVAACVCALAWGAAAQETKPAEPKVSGGERSAADKIDKAKGAEAKIQAAAEFLKKYPQSALRPKVAEAIASEVSATTDPQLKASLAETYLALFNAPGEADRVGFQLLDAYITAERVEDAFRAGAAWLQKNPDDAHTLYRLSILASNEVIKGNKNFAALGRQYGARAAELIEADKMPPNVEAAQWAAFKAEALPTVYRATGIIALKTDDAPAARQLLEKAVAHKTTDPGVFLVLADLLNQEYERTAKEHQVAAAADKPALRKKADEQLDRVMESYARAIAVAEGNPQYQPAAAALRENLTAYYKYRHNSTDGVQQLIDKYKKQ